MLICDNHITEICTTYSIFAILNIAYLYLVKGLDKYTTTFLLDQLHFLINQCEFLYQTSYSKSHNKPVVFQGKCWKCDQRLAPLARIIQEAARFDFLYSKTQSISALRLPVPAQKIRCLVNYIKTYVTAWCANYNPFCYRMIRL